MVTIRDVARLAGVAPITASRVINTSGYASEEVRLRVRRAADQLGYVPNTLARSLRSRNEIKLFVNHDTSRVLASKRAGTLRLSESQRGLEVEADLPDTTDGRDMAVLLKRGDIDSMSFGFSVPKGGDSWSDDGQERELRELIVYRYGVEEEAEAWSRGLPAAPSLRSLRVSQRSRWRGGLLRARRPTAPPVAHTRAAAVAR